MSDLTVQQYCRQHEPDTMAPLLNTLISRIVLGQTKKSQPYLPRPASITFSEGDFPGGHPQYEGYPSQSSSLGHSPMRGAPKAGPFGNSLAQGSSSQPLTVGSSLMDAHVYPESATFKARLLQNLAAQANARTAPEAEGQGSSKYRQQGQDTASAPLQTSSLQNQSTSDADSGIFGHAHGYNGTKDAFGAAGAAAVPFSNTSDSDLQTAAKKNDTASGAQTNAVGTDSSDAPLSKGADQSHAHATEHSTADQDSFIELVQGTEQLLGMLGARDVP